MLTAAGLVIGAIAAFTIGHLLSAQLFEVSAFDPMTAISTMIVLLLTSLPATCRRGGRAGSIRSWRYAASSTNVIVVP